MRVFKTTSPKPIHEIATGLGIGWVAGAEEGRRVAIIAANEFEDIELLYPLIRLSEEGAEVVIVPIMKGSHPRPVAQKPVTGRYGTPIPFGFLREGERHLIMKLDEIDPKKFDALIIPGGFSPDRLRVIPEVLKLVREFHERGSLSRRSAMAHRS